MRSDVLVVLFGQYSFDDEILNENLSSVDSKLSRNLSSVDIFI